MCNTNVVIHNFKLSFPCFILNFYTLYSSHIHHSTTLRLMPAHLQALSVTRYGLFKNNLAVVSSGLTECTALISDNR